MTFDVAARLGEGLPAVSNTQTYVSACRAVGYQHPDLTATGAQIRDWYGGEDGLDLHALDADCAALRAAADAADEALAVQRDGLGLLTAAWDGETGSQAADFIGRHGTAAARVVNELRVAADACAALRDTLWRLVDAKVDAAVSIDERHAGERSGWLAAAGAVVGGGGGGERAAAVEVVTGRIVPYVDNDIRAEWVAAMRSATAGVSRAYQDTVGRINVMPAAHFEVPGRLLPPRPPGLGHTSEVGAAVPTVTAGYAPPPAAPSSAPPPAAPPLPPPAAASAPIPPPGVTAAQPPLAAAMPEQPMQPGLGAPPAAVPGAPDVAGGLSGVVGQIMEAIDSLLSGTADDPATDPIPDPAEASRKEDRAGGETAAGADDRDAEDVPAEQLPAPGSVSEETGAAEPSAGVGGPPYPPPAPPSLEAEQLPPAVQPLEAELPAPPEDRTPCEIAAGELPQVGQ